jgi:hypothetical protein
MAYYEQLQSLYRRYEKDGHMQPFTMHELAAWAYDNGLCQPQRSTIVTRMAEDFSRAMRADFHVDAQGRRVRTKHVAMYERGGKQFALWADLRAATREHMERSFQQRRQGIVGDCRQLKTDVDSYNDNQNTGELIQLVLDFTDDMAEYEALKAVA